MERKIRNINKVEMVDAAQMRDISIVHGVGVYLGYERETEVLPLVGLAEYIISSTTEGHEVTYESSLQGSLWQYVSFPTSPRCFILTAVDGSRYLMGTSEKPSVTIDVEITFAGTPDATSEARFIAKLTDDNGILPIIDG